DDDAIGAVKMAIDEDMAYGVLIGDEEKIKEILKHVDIKKDNIEIINQPVPQKAVLHALDLYHSGRVDLIMKGSITTGVLLRVLLNKENGIRTGKVLSHVGVFEIEGINKLMYISDAAINIKPSISEKVDICKNAIYIAHRLGNKRPKVAMITPFERIELDSIPSSVDAAVISKMGDCGQIEGADIEGPVSLDLAISKKAASVKHYNRPIAGEGDIFIVPDIEAGNIFYKGVIYFARCKMAGLVAGARTPIILTSRSDSEDIKLNSIALAIMIKEGENV
ncbi:MAG: phosphate acyltransferase, partial [Elusimicrobiota bacterium]